MSKYGRASHRCQRRYQVGSRTNLVRRAREIARQFGQERIYDSLYAALAELHGCEFWTADKVFYFIGL